MKQRFHISWAAAFAVFFFAACPAVLHAQNQNRQNNTQMNNQVNRQNNSQVNNRISNSPVVSQPSPAAPAAPSSGAAPPSGASAPAAAAPPAAAAHAPNAPRSQAQNSAGNHARETNTHSAHIHQPPAGEQRANKPRHATPDQKANTSPPQF